MSFHCILRCDLLSRLLIPLHLSREQNSFFQFHSSGLKVVCENKAKSFQARAYLKKDSFHTFQLEQDIIVCVNTSAVLACLNLYEDTNVEIRINVEGHMLLKVEQAGGITECRIATIQFDTAPVMLNFKNKATVNQVQMRVQQLKECLGDLDIGAKEVHLEFHGQYFRLMVQAQNMESELTFQNSPDADYIEFDCKIPAIHCYTYSLLRQALSSKSISNSSLIGFGAREDGFLCISLTFDVNETNSRVEFILAPLDEEVVN